MQVTIEVSEEEARAMALAAAVATMSGIDPQESETGRVLVRVIDAYAAAYQAEHPEVRVAPSVEYEIRPSSENSN